MGCAISGLGLAPRQTTEPKSEEDAVAHLTGEQIDMIKDSWKVIQEDIAKVGIIMFVRLFETHPECKDVFFLFRDVEDLERLRTSRELRAHGLRVMSFIEKTVARLDQLERLELLALELGKSHFRYNAPPKYYGYVGAEFICAVQPILKDQWTPELEEAWKEEWDALVQYLNEQSPEEDTDGAYSGTSQAAMTDWGRMERVVEWDKKLSPGTTQQMDNLFQYVTGIMKRGYQEEERSRRHHIVVSAKERPDKKNTAL